eukprot:3010858-Rhodomonas_salina.2
MSYCNTRIQTRAIAPGAASTRMLIRVRPAHWVAYPGTRVPGYPGTRRPTVQYNRDETVHQLVIPFVPTYALILIVIVIPGYQYNKADENVDVFVCPRFPLGLAVTHLPLSRFSVGPLSLIIRAKGHNSGF